VSSVVGVALMIAITTLLGATVGVFATGVAADMPGDQPVASFDVAFHDAAPGANDSLTVTHEGGDAVPGHRLRFVVSDASVAESDGAEEAVRVERPNRWIDVAGVSEEVTAGASATLGPEDYRHVASGRDVYDGVNLDGDAEYGGVQLDRATVRLVWIDGDRSSTLVVWRGPNA
jgi:FlaG/FlaF family flagellin (archaellin)